VAPARKLHHAQVSLLSRRNGKLATDNQNSIFTATNDVNVKDEYTYGQKYGSAAASQRLKQHWDTFVTEPDFARMKSYGLNHVRIPIGYWGVPGIMNLTEPFATGQYPYLLKAVGWAQKYGLKVIVDLHGAPASQNGFDNSGRMGKIGWHQSQYDVDKTLRTLKYMINDFVTKPQYRDTGKHF
jgi:glucan 1,3-beta-glucosidase